LKEHLIGIFIGHHESREIVQLLRITNSRTKNVWQ